MAAETITPVSFMDERRLSIATNATYEIEWLCNIIIEKANSPSAGMDGVLFRGLATRIAALNGALMDAVGDSDRPTEEIYVDVYQRPYTAAEV